MSPDAFDSILSSYEDIGGHIPQLQKYSNMFVRNVHLQQLLLHVYKDVLDFHQHAIHLFAHKGEKPRIDNPVTLLKLVPSMEAGLQKFLEGLHSS